MLKRKMTIILTALMIGSFAACNTQNGQDTAENTSVNMTQSQNSSSVETIRKNDSSKTTESASESQKETESSAEESSKTTAPSQNSSESRKSKTESSPSDSATGKTAPDTSSTAPAETSQSTTESGKTTTQSGKSTSDSDETAAYTVNTFGKLDTSDLFTKRDLEQTPDTSSAKTIQASSNTTETITEEGIYIIKGTASNFTVKVEADKEDKVQLVLDNLNVTNTSFPVIYVVSADKCFVTTTSSENTLTVTGTLTADGDTNTDAVIFSKDDLVFNGTGSLTIISKAGNGISGKDDIKFTGGTYNITSAKDSIEAHDSIAVYDGTFTINSSKDGLHSENDEDDTVGWIYIMDGSFTIKASSDAIQATTVAQIDGGNLTLTASEGIEATYVQINGGSVNITASDDGIKGAQKSRSFGTPTIEFNGGTTTISMGQGDTDAVDANGNIIVNGGTINITAPTSSFDYDGTAQYNGGTIIINGTQVNSIPQSMMGGGMGGMGGMRGGRSGRMF